MMGLEKGRTRLGAPTRSGALLLTIFLAAGASLHAAPSADPPQDRTPPWAASTETPAGPEPSAPPLIWWSAPADPPPGHDPVLPEGMGIAEGSGLDAEFRGEVGRRSAVDPIGEVGTSLLGGAEWLVGGAFSWFAGLIGGSAPGEEGGSSFARLLDIGGEPRKPRIFEEFLRQWTDSEAKYFAAFDETRMDPYGFSSRADDQGPDDLSDEQEKLLWDALARTYFGRYRTYFHEQIPGDLMEVWRWSALDFAVLPPLIGGYVYQRGLEKRVRMGDTEFRISLDPVAELFRPDPDRTSVGALEWSVDGIPASLILSTGLESGRFVLDFVGVGTSIVRRALEAASGY